MGIYCRFLLVPDNIQRCSHCTRGKWETKSTRTSVSLDDTTTVLNWLCTACNTNLVSASSCVAFNWAKSVLVFDDLTASSSRNPPATTISLSSGAWMHSSSDRKCARSTLLSGSDRKFVQFFGRGTSRLSTGRLIVRRVLVPPLMSLFCICQIRCLSVDTYNLPSILLLRMYRPNPQRSLHYQAFPKTPLVPVRQ